MTDLKNHYRSLENMLKQAQCNVDVFHGIDITIDHQTCTMSIPLSPKYFHAAKATHGFLYFKMLDEAAFFAANSIVPDVFVLTTNFTTNLLRPITTGTLHAEGHVINVSKSQILAESKLYNDDGKLVATGQGSFARSRILLDTLAGYNA